jgi:hypothetical protein
MPISVMENRSDSDILQTIRTSTGLQAGIGVPD